MSSLKQKLRHIFIDHLVTQVPPVPETNYHYGRSEAPKIEDLHLIKGDLRVTIENFLKYDRKIKPNTDDLMLALDLLLRAVMEL